MRKIKEKQLKREKNYPHLSLKQAREMVVGWTVKERQEYNDWINAMLIQDIEEYYKQVVVRDKLNEKPAKLLRILFSERMIEIENWPLEEKMLLFQVQMIGEKRRKSGKIVVPGKEMLVMADTALDYIVTPVMDEFYQEIRRDNQEKIDRIKQLNKRIEEELDNYRKIKERLKELKNRSVFHRDGFLGTGKDLLEIAELEKKLKELNNENEHHVNIKF